ncbi:hypothetical protein DDZ13_00800 [Coraliomargarita sinensis]|uniref:Uncharacterized protein n=1 Tax=Coraliomargarita sinensis TaxID=2174842 RepID=A0A317ZNL8_9BACT|nr:hypothetical protein [Coraliomargarita sinensis]PXA05439.1 hypothetical protein DDZ13_00800 [Coraliomargarita sinensis]
MITITGGKSCPIDLIVGAAKYLLALTLALTATTSSAQSSEDLFRGTWQVQVPEKGALVIILKSQGLASYFWGDNTDRTVYQGNWSHTDSSATATWEDGSSHVIERSGSGFTVTHQGATGNEIYSSAGSQLPQEILGQWAKPPTREDDMRSDRDQAKGYFGIWKLADTEDFLFVEPDRSAATNIGKDGGQRGEWAKQGSELHIIWDSGQYGILRETERGFNYKQVESGMVIEDDETETIPATRTIESNVPAAWYADYKTEREADSGGLAFSSRKVARAFYRGDWLVRRGNGKYERLELARFGGLTTSKDRSLDGQWTMTGQDVFMRWDDGMRKVLSPVGHGFVLYEYRPGRPLDGVPTRILAAAPEDTAKLAEHLEGRKDVAQQMRQMAEAAGIDPTTQEDAGWGRTFARWAWPFGNEEGGVTTEEMLAEEFEPEASSDPWWWPFWSEKPESEVSSEANAAEVTTDTSAENAPASDHTEAPETEEAEASAAPVELVEIEEAESAQESVDSDQETNAPDAPAESKNSSAKDWLWPF